MEMTRESLTQRFNDLLDSWDNNKSDVWEDTVRRWSREGFPGHGISPVQSDNYEKVGS